MLPAYNKEFNKQWLSLIWGMSITWTEILPMCLRKLNCRIPCHLFASHWIRIASIVFCFVLQRPPTNENNSGTDSAVTPLRITKNTTDNGNPCFKEKIKPWRKSYRCAYIQQRTYHGRYRCHLNHSLFSFGHVWLHRLQNSENLDVGSRIITIIINQRLFERVRRRHYNICTLNKWFHQQTLNLALFLNWSATLGGYRGFRDRYVVVSKSILVKCWYVAWQHQLTTSFQNI